MSSIISVKNVSKSFHTGVQNIPVLNNISFEAAHNDFLIIYGPSGCGKSTLLHTLLGLEPPTSGSITILDKNLYHNSSEDDRSDFRKHNIGMVYQQSNWIKSLTVLENVAFPLLLLGIQKPQALQKAMQMLKMVNLQDWANYIPTELSSGQQQRVGLSRALITDPKLIIADEPTGNLDFEASQNLMNLLSKLNKNDKKTIIMVTHDLEYLKFAKTIVRMLNGEIVEKSNNKNITKIIKNAKVKKGELN
jgi:putative ABC transport system ATP-binding protein